MSDGAAPLKEQLLKECCRAGFQQLALSNYEQELADLRARRDEFGVEEEQSYANAAARACGQAAWFCLILHDFEDEKFPPKPKPRRRR
jgi:hypothetical protein